jgi:putative PIN family toxin of toxin-antitoxin system
MPKSNIKTIIDTNLFISFLIGKRLSGLKKLLTNSRVDLIFAEQNIKELRIVTSRNKFRKYFPPNDVNDLIDFVRIIGKVYKIEKVPKICRDPKDDFLLALAKKSKADYLVTGDVDLLVLKTYGKTNIISAAVFEKIIHSAF